MNIREEILKEHSKRQTMRIIHFIGDDKKRFKELMEVFLKGEYRVTQRAAWVVGDSGLAHPELIRPYMKRLLEKLKEPGVHVAVKRNIVRLWEEVEIPDELSGKIYDICFAYLRSPDETIAVKAFSMTTLARICKQYPELKDELRLTIEDMMPYGSAAIISRGNKILKAFQKP